MQYSCIKLMKSVSKDIYDVSKYFYFKYVFYFWFKHAVILNFLF